MFAAGRAAECGAHVLLLEKTPRLGNKLRLTGKGRCNLTNQTSLADFVSHFGPQGRFLYSAFSRFFAADLLDWLANRGVSTVVERGHRVFPASGDANEIVAALEGYLLTNGVQVERQRPADKLLIASGQVTGVEAKHQAIPAAAVVLATGGASYPRTGSTGDGYRLAAQAGHTIVDVRPALVPLLTEEPWVPPLQGLSLRNVRVTLLSNNKPIADDFGDLLFTHFGVSGPTVLALSRRAIVALEDGSVQLAICLKPGLTVQELDERLLHELRTASRKQISSILATLLPERLVSTFLHLLSIVPNKPGHQITVDERRRLAGMLQDLRITVIGSRPLSEAIVTAGGVDTREIDPRTLESRLVRGLFFCGEVIDIDADTGGYNLQAAFSTGYLAGESAARSVKCP